METEKEESIIQEYLHYTNLHKKTYGEKTVVFMQVGSFYEVYGLKYPGEDKITGSCMTEITEITGLSIASKKCQYNGAMVFMAGFRDYSIDKYLPLLLNEGYIIAEYIQEPETTESENKKQKKKNRILKDIHSIGTYISYDMEQNTALSNNIVCIWMECIGKKRKWMFGMSIVNSYTGESTIFEYEMEDNLHVTTLDEIEHNLSIYNPSEIIWISPSDAYKSMDSLHLSPKITIHTMDLHAEIIKKVSKQKYIDYMLQTVFGPETFQICTEFSYYMYATQSFCYLLHFIQEHNPNLSKKIKMPIFKNAIKKMILANHTLKQLNIINDPSLEIKGNLSSVHSFLNKCNTAIGKRKFREQLTNPVFCEKWLENEYRMTAFLLEKEPEMIDFMRNQLSTIRDIEKFSLQIVNKKIYVSTIHTLYKSIQNSEQINICIQEFPREILSYFYEGNESPPFLEILDFLDHFFIWDQENNNNFQGNIFKKGISLEIDAWMENQDLAMLKFQEIREYFIGLIRKHNKKEDEIEYIKINETEKNGYTLQLTKTRGELLQSILKREREKEATIHLEHIQFSLKDVNIKSTSKSNVELVLPILEDLCKEMNVCKQNIQKKRGEVFLEILSEIERTQMKTIEHISKFVGNLDVIVCKAYLAKTFHYCRPIIDTTAPNAFVHALELRHVLIENLLQHEIYVPNDISLGNKEDVNGILLYGTNAVGKTSFIRALGIAIIMAQSGLYVPCSQFEYKPYQAIYSRILSNDNLFKGLSTFAVEMSELRVILKQADENSFVLGDELCSGTEMESALSIFMAALEHLHEKNTSFIFATHFHEIADYEELHSLPKIRLKHLKVHYDRERDCLVYDRKIREGSGERNYGLEVCKSLYLPETFMERAYALRRKYNAENDGSLSHTSSHFNSKKIRGFCEKCHIRLGEEIHHLQPQQMADKDGFIEGYFHKNHPGNLMSVCKKCHDAFHSLRSISPLTMQSSPVQKRMVRKKTTKGYILEEK